MEMRFFPMKPPIQPDNTSDIEETTPTFMCRLVRDMLRAGFVGYTIFLKTEKDGET
jgi:hypothetical protein